MSIQEDVRSALMRRLQRIPGIGAVHAFERLPDDQSELASLYTSGGKLLGWHLRRGAVEEFPFSSTLNRVQTTWRIRGIAQVDDSQGSELALEALVDAISASFRRVPLLKNADREVFARTAITESAGIQADEITVVEFAGMRCHSIWLSLAVEHFEEIEPRLSEDAEVAGYDEDGYLTGEPCPTGHVKHIDITPND